MTPRLTQIDDLTRSDHWYLDSSDECVFLGEYTARMGYAFSETNQLIYNLKKKPSRRAKPAEWAHKTEAIRHVAKVFGELLREKFLSEATLVPMPPSKAKDHPEYDDRMLCICRGMRPEVKLDIRELLEVRASLDASHESDVRPTVDDLADNMIINEGYADPSPKAVLLLDDVLTTGAHFKAAKRVLRARFGDIRVVGLFVARRVPESINWDDIELGKRQ